MRVQIVPKKAELRLKNLENLILVENSEDGVVIRAICDKPVGGRAVVIRYLAAEGFISDEFQNFGKGASHHTTSITWAVDRDWVRNAPAILQRANRFMIRLILTVSILWLALMGLLHLTYLTALLYYGTTHF